MDNRISWKILLRWEDIEKDREVYISKNSDGYLVSVYEYGDNQMHRFIPWFRDVDSLLMVTLEELRWEYLG